MNEDEVNRFLNAIDSFEFSENLAYRNRLILKLLSTQE